MEEGMKGKDYDLSDDRYSSFPFFKILTKLGMTGSIFDSFLSSFDLYSWWTYDRWDANDYFCSDACSTSDSAFSSLFDESFWSKVCTSTSDFSKVFSLWIIYWFWTSDMYNKLNNKWSY